MHVLRLFCEAIIQLLSLNTPTPHFHLMQLSVSGSPVSEEGLTAPLVLNDLIANTHIPGVMTRSAHTEVIKCILGPRFQ